MHKCKPNQITALRGAFFSFSKLIVYITLQNVEVQPNQITALQGAFFSFPKIFKIITYDGSNGCGQRPVLCDKPVGKSVCQIFDLSTTYPSVLVHRLDRSVACDCP